MPAILDISDLINLSTGGAGGAPEQIDFFKTNRIQGAAAPALSAGRKISLWRFDGQPGVSGNIPAASAVTNNTTSGALRQTSPAGGKQKWLCQMIATGITPGTLELVDTLNISGNLSAIVTTAQAVTTPALTRYTTGVGVQIGVVIWTAIGATVTTIIASYTNSAGVAGRTTRAVAFGGSGNQEANRLITLPLQDGDVGVQSVQSITVAASTATAGAFGVTMFRSLATVEIPLAGVTQAWNDFSSESGDVRGPREVLSDACLSLNFIGNNTTVPEIYSGSLFFVEK